MAAVVVAGYRPALTKLSCDTDGHCAEVAWRWCTAASRTVQPAAVGRLQPGRVWLLLQQARHRAHARPVPLLKVPLEM